jgi:hypothetical protein
MAHPSGSSSKLVLRFGSVERKREIAEAAAREGVPVVHFLYECYLAWKHQRELTRIDEDMLNPLRHV